MNITYYAAANIVTGLLDTVHLSIMDHLITVMRVVYTVKCT